MNSEICRDDRGGWLGMCRSKVEGTLATNLETLKKKIEDCGETKQRSKLSAIYAVGEHLSRTFPLLVAMYCEVLNRDRNVEEKVHYKRPLSVHV